MSKSTQTIEVPGKAEVTLPPVKGYSRGVRLVPGKNEVSSGYLAELHREHKGTPEDPDPRPVVRTWMRAGLIKMPAVSLDEVPEKLPNTLVGLKLSVCATLISSAQNVELLQKWRARDDRGGVHALIEDRLEELAPPANLPATLTDLTVEKAKPFIEACSDPDQLDAWKASDTRSGIHKAIEERIDALLADLDG